MNTKRILLFPVVVLVLALTGLPIHADHSWGPPYHWARTSNPFTLQLGDNVSSAWDAYLVEASNDWNPSNVLDTVIVPGGTNPRRCRPTAGRVEVCSATYGQTGWLGVAQIWVNGDHIVQGTAKMNDTYFNTATYNTPAWRRLVMCQEIAHDFGLDHQDENFNNPNLGSCMDYTSDPDGPPSNEHPNQHDFDQLEIIYSHLDSTTTVGSLSGIAHMPPGFLQAELPAQAEWGVLVHSSARTALFMRDFGSGLAVFTFVIWA